MEVAMNYVHVAIRLHGLTQLGQMLVDTEEHRCQAFHPEVLFVQDGVDDLDDGLNWITREISHSHPTVQFFVVGQKGLVSGERTDHEHPHVAMGEEQVILANLVIGLDTLFVEGFGVVCNCGKHVVSFFAFEHLGCLASRLHVF